MMTSCDRRCGLREPFFSLRLHMAALIALYLWAFQHRAFSSDSCVQHLEDIGLPTCETPAPAIMRIGVLRLPIASIALSGS